MATIVAGLGCSHAPSIAHAYDSGASREPGMKPLFDAFAQAARWLAERRPDALVVIYNDHVDNYFFDAWSTFAIGVASEYQIADEGWGPRRFAPVPGHRALARHLAVQLLDGGFDLTTSHRMELDHGFLSPMPMIDEGWHVPVVPMTINCTSSEPIGQVGNGIKRGSGSSGLKFWLRMDDAAGVEARWFSA
jgi:gallate dioxygenase